MLLPYLRRLSAQYKTKGIVVHAGPFQLWQSLSPHMQLSMANFKKCLSSNWLIVMHKIWDAMEAAILMHWSFCKLNKRGLQARILIKRKHKFVPNLPISQRGLRNCWTIQWLSLIQLLHYKMRWIMGLSVLRLMHNSRFFNFIKRVWLILLCVISPLIMLWWQLGMIISQQMEVNHTLS